MARGIARMMGIRLMLNFDNPYLATGLGDFWHRWHISLSTWFRDYVYIPLGGNRKGKLATYLNMFLTMVLSGLWHGAAWTFVLWGAVHALGNFATGSWSEPPSTCTRCRRRQAADGAGVRDVRLGLLPGREHRRRRDDGRPDVHVGSGRIPMSRSWPWP